MPYPKYSIGIGDRFAREGAAQLDALIMARNQGVHVAPVWNKPHREHTIVGSRPADLQAEADDAVKIRHWNAPYFVDADDIGLKTVDAFLESCDFFTLDAADWIGVESVSVPGIERPLDISQPMIAAALRHAAACRTYNPNLRQLLHVGYKIAAEMGDRFTAALQRHSKIIGANVAHNLYERHIRPLFLGR